MMEFKPRYRVCASCETGLRTATRQNAPSAMVLADRWVQEGCSEVGIIDHQGVMRDLESFRATLPLVRRLGLRTRYRQGDEAWAAPLISARPDWA